tara:strand:+ start:72 stop:632 length:561 start_codon:yes stop_codon:yes gene_type:complete
MPRNRKDIVPPVEHVDEDEYAVGRLMPIEDFLDRHHPQNDQYVRGVEHVQNQIVHQSSKLRPKQVQILKTLFLGLNYVKTAARHNTTAITVSRLAKSEDGARLLKLLQYHLTLLEGPNLAQRRNMLWRIGQENELVDPKVTISAVSELNKMTYKEWEQTNPQHSTQTPVVQININQDLLPKTTLDS